MNQKDSRRFHNKNFFFDAIFYRIKDAVHLRSRTILPTPGFLSLLKYRGNIHRQNNRYTGLPEQGIEYDLSGRVNPSMLAHDVT